MSGTSTSPSLVELSIVIPVKNERENLPLLMSDLARALAPCGVTHEVLFIDDGSDDGTVPMIGQLKAQYPAIRLLKFDRNYGKTAALQAGFEHARGEVLIIMDGDRQNDPADIPHFLEAIKHHDIVCGYRAHRLDSKFRLIQSRLANRIRNRFTHDGVRDSGCGYQALRRACLGKIRLYGGMHRFLPCLFQMEGFTFNQIPVNHHPRRAGVSKYPFWGRLIRATIDLCAVRWMIFRHIHFHISEEQ